MLNLTSEQIRSLEKVIVKIGKNYDSNDIDSITILEDIDAQIRVEIHVKPEGYLITTDGETSVWLKP